MPEILRTSLASTVLFLKAQGIDDVLNFDFLDKPPVPAIVRCVPFAPPGSCPLHNCPCLPHCSMPRISLPALIAACAPCGPLAPLAHTRHSRTPHTLHPTHPTHPTPRAPHTLMPAPPPPRSLELLLSLGALDQQGKLTHPLGSSLARLPVDPMYGKALLAAAGMGCSIESMQVRARCAC